jgi:PAS domain S-box-containing protein
MNDIFIDKFRLKFPDELEQIYVDETFHNSLKQLRINIIVVGVIYAIFGIVDVVVTPAVKYQAWFIRYAFILPLTAAVFAFSFSRHFRRYQQIAVSFLALMGGAGIVVLIDLTHGEAPYLHFAGLLLVFMTTYTAFKLRFLTATIVGWTIIGMYEVSAIWLHPPALTVFLTDNFFYISANLMGMFTNYQRDLYSRREFLQVRRIQEVEQLKHTLEKDLLNEAVDRAVRSLRESESRFRTLAETTAAAIIIHRGSRFLYVNPTVQRLTGYDEGEYSRMEFWEIVHPDHRDMVRERGESRMSGKDVLGEYEFKVVTKSGDERWVTATAGIIDYEGAPAVIATLFDITDRKRAEDERVRLYEERIQEEERHTREKENIIMELHDGIGGITTNISILAEVAQRSSDVEGFRDKLATISQLAREGINEIRGFMRSIDTSGLSWRMLAAEIRNQGNTMLEPHGIGCVFETVIDDDAAGEPGSLLCLNLFKIHKEALTNTIKHARATTVTVDLSVDNQVLRLMIGDNGIGCSQHTSRGRGLANIRKRVADLGGTVSLSSDSGTRLDLEIPLAPPSRVLERTPRTS